MHGRVGPRPRDPNGGVRNMMIKRRRLLELGGAGLVGGAALGTSLWSREAQAKAEQIVVRTWGWLWGDSLRDNVDAAFQKRTGVKVVQDRGSSPVERITKLKVGLSNQTVDILQIHDGLVPLAIKQGVVEKLD